MLALVLAIVAGGCGEDPDPPIAIFGDSLTFDAQDAIEEIAADEDVPVTVLGVPGAASCDLRAQMDQALRENELAALVFVFAGNRLTPCSGGRTGDELADLYEADARAIAERARDEGVPVVLAGPPDMGLPVWSENAVLLNQRMREVAGAVDGAQYLDLRTVLTPDGYTAQLACEDGEDASRGCTDGQIAVRDGDRVHFDRPGADGYSAGSARFARALIAAARGAR